MAELGDQVNARILYWGPEGAGKRMNLRVIHGKLRPDHRGDLREVPTDLDPTVHSSVLPIELGNIGGVRTRIQVVAVPGGDEQAATRKQLLDGVDGIVFVVDSRTERIDDNLRSFEELRDALADYGRPLDQVPLVIQYNKRDIGDPYTLDELHRKLSMRGVAAFEAVASQGTAVLQTLTTISKRVIRHLREQNQESLDAPQPTEVEPVAAPAAPPISAAEPVGGSHEEASPPPPAEPEGSGLAAAQPRSSSALDPALLASDPFEDDSHTSAAEAAHAVFADSFEAAHEAATSAPAGRLVIESVGAASATGPTTVRIPIVVRDEDGRSRRLVVSVSIDPEEPEAS